jgi:hypothetical protein
VPRDDQMIEWMFRRQATLFLAAFALLCIITLAGC